MNPIVQAEVTRYLRARLLCGAVALVGFGAWAWFQPLAWSLVVAALLFTAVSLLQVRRPLANQDALIGVDALIVFGAVMVARPYPGVEATALALVASTAIVFGRRGSIRVILPLLATFAAFAGVINWAVRPPPGWDGGEMLLNAVIATVAVAPVIHRLALFMAAAFPGDSVFVSVFDDPEQFANVVTEHSNEGIAVIDLDSNIRYANPALGSIFGFLREELVGGSMSLLMDDETYRRHHAGVHAAAGRDQGIEGANLELVGRHRDGQPITALVSLSELSSQGERLILGAVRDVTEMVELRSQLQRSVVAKDEFIAAVSHELRTPLTAVVAFSEMIRDQPDMDPAERVEFIDLVASQARDVSYLIDDLLVAARLDSDSVAIALKPTNLRAEVVEAIVAWTGQRSLEVDHVALNRAVMTDPRRLRQILRNLVSNAVKYGGDEISITASDAGDGMCHVLVRDNGPGVPPGRERLIFEPYEHSHDVEGQPLSIGLGLHVSRRLAEAMGGSLEYRRHLGLTEFALAVPEEITAEVR